MTEPCSHRHLHPARLLGAEIAPFDGRQIIADIVFAAIGGLDHGPVNTMPRGRAGLFALVEAQHLPRNDHSRHLLLKHVYKLKLSRHGETWTIGHIRIDMVWFTGEPAVLFRVAD